ncbi:protein of unknown function [Methylocella tundrae]|uniref:Uncharacterized protein n=1 Tax=Methylocella tundrae TaxID=227605 RepID=A0A4U8Z1E1_METTU|nr:protein of unknown function [Methylocella tundrae]
MEGPYIREFEKYPHFHAAYWSFPSVVRWVAERTEKSANGVYVDQDHIVPALTEIQKALKSGAARRGAARCERGRFTHSPKAAKPPTWAAS